jgi:putative zinc finger protein
MTPMMDCSEARLSLGVYVLGAIDPAERAMVDSHLAGCRYCRDELAGLAGLPALLARVSTEEAVALAASGAPPVMQDEGPPPPQLAASVLDLTAARRKRRTWREATLGVAAALVIAAGVFGGLRMTAAPQVIKVTEPAPTFLQTGPGGTWEDAVGQSGTMTALVKYRPVHWGTQFTATVSGIPSGVTCQIWVVGPGKTRLLAGSWTVDGDEGSVWYPGSAAISAPKVQEFVITVGKTRSITAEA